MAGLREQDWDSVALGMGFGYAGLTVVVQALPWGAPAGHTRAFSAVGVWGELVGLAGGGDVLAAAAVVWWLALNGCLGWLLWRRINGRCGGWLPWSLIWLATALYLAFSLPSLERWAWSGLALCLMPLPPIVIDLLGERYAFSRVLRAYC